MDLELLNLPYSGLVLAIALGLSEVMKRVGVPTRFIPFVAIVVAFLGVWALGGWSWSNVIVGVAYGLMASGFWSGTKAVAGK